MTPEEYMDRPYHFILIWDEKIQTWIGTVKEFPGCIARGDTWEIVFAIRRAALSWIAAALDQGQGIPEPDMRRE
jgi:predicted RNase H-like HicB family nuclease